MKKINNKKNKLLIFLSFFLSLSLSRKRLSQFCARVVARVLNNNNEEEEEEEERSMAAAKKKKKMKKMKQKWAAMEEEMMMSSSPSKAAASMERKKRDEELFVVDTATITHKTSANASAGGGALFLTKKQRARMKTLRVDSILRREKVEKSYPKPTKHRAVDGNVAVMKKKEKEEEEGKKTERTLERADEQNGRELVGKALPEGHGNRPTGDENFATDGGSKARETGTSGRGRMFVQSTRRFAKRSHHESGGEGNRKGL